ncbi:hypothetical protein CEXT_267931 [Caerostris extrusa]|uniref:Uncharacterized protein n=1 Tax=Caerostris extrusa TaxID=172846 RepID=A0AAV4TJB2_CAEEX|nr:hypothetical protein CEXT_267931 [Caerostris extrusa]
MINYCKFLQNPCGDFLKVFWKVSTDLSNIKKNRNETEVRPVVFVPSAPEQCRDLSQVVQTSSSKCELNHVLWHPPQQDESP